MSSSGRSIANIPTPSTHGLLAWTFDPGSGATTGAAATAATIYLGRIEVVSAITVSKVYFNLQVSGTGATAVSNAQCGLYSSAGVLLGSSTAADMAAGGSAAVDEATAPATLNVTLTAASTGSLNLAAGTFAWAAIHIGTQASTAVQILLGGNAGATVVNAGLTASTARSGTYTGHASNNLATIGNLTPASITLAARNVWLAVA